MKRKRSILQSQRKRERKRETKLGEGMGMGGLGRNIHKQNMLFLPYTSHTTVFPLFLPLPFLSAAFLCQTSFSSLHGNGISLFCLSLNICFCMLAVLYYVVRFYILIYHFSSRRKKYAMNYLSNLDCVDVVNFNFVHKI